MKEHIYTFTLTGDNLTDQDIQKHAMEAANDYVANSFDGPYKNIEVKATGPLIRSETYYIVQVYAEEVCLHLSKDVSQANQGYVCNCGMKVVPLSFGESNAS